jgi:hypothetical protein
MVRKPLDICGKGTVLRVNKPGHMLHGKKVTATSGGRTLKYLGQDFGEVIDIVDSFGAEFSLPVGWFVAVEDQEAA